MTPTIHNVKRATAAHPIMDVIADRWSPYVFDPRPVEREKLLSCLEAARWSASSYNEQPWSFLIARREAVAEFAQMLGCLMEANQSWAKDAGALLITVASQTFQRNGSPNRVASHDIGLAVGNFSVQATALGLSVHQMAGIDLNKTRETYAIPEMHEPLTAIALGYAAPANTTSSPLADRDRTPRQRKTLTEIVFAGGWNRPAAWL